MWAVELGRKRIGLRFGEGPRRKSNGTGPQPRVVENPPGKQRRSAPASERLDLLRAPPKTTERGHRHRRQGSRFWSQTAGLRRESEGARWCRLALETQQLSFRPRLLPPDFGAAWCPRGQIHQFVAHVQERLQGA